jgi:hypothetical protein
MSQSIRLSDELIEAAKAKAALHHRSPPQQIEHWAAIGRVMETALSYPAVEKAAEWGSSKDVDALLGEVASEVGQARTRQIIRKGAGALYGANPRDPDRVVRRNP